MPNEFWQLALKESVEFQIASRLLSFFYRTPGQPAFRALRDSGRHIVLAQDSMVAAGRGTIGFTYLVCGEGLMIIIDFPNLPKARQFLDTKDMARAIFKINPAITVEGLMAYIQRELASAEVVAE